MPCGNGLNTKWKAQEAPVCPYNIREGGKWASRAISALLSRDSHIPIAVADIYVNGVLSSPKNALIQTHVIFT